MIASLHLMSIAMFAYTDVKQKVVDEESKCQINLSTSENEMLLHAHISQWPEKHGKFTPLRHRQTVAQV